ncbi:MAG TPA: hypothetical protein PLX79_01760 [Candidatus Dojkabacteria bacterium]|nr:hypothetical protein [Candidatus Dojkabacteria bacterium]
MASEERKGRLIKSIFLILLFLGLCVLLFYYAYNLRSKYNVWVAEFWTDNQKNVVDLNDSEQIKVLSNQTENKITVFSESTKKNDFIELNLTESAYLIGNNINKVSPSFLKVSKIVIEPQDNQKDNIWDIYLLFETPKIKNISVKITLQKDNIETAQVYSTDFAIANFSLNEIGIEFFTNKINQGLSDSLLLVNENSYSGRVYKNIELDNEGMVIKGILL